MSTDRNEDLGECQQRFQREEMRDALRALLMTPLMDATHEDFAAVRRHADRLREWFARETGWILHVERDGARLYKRPADLTDATRGVPSYDRRRYVLLCLACAVLERADPQITLRLLGERLLELAADPALAALGCAFTLSAHQERRELVVVCRTLLALGVLQHVAGDEEASFRPPAQKVRPTHSTMCIGGPWLACWPRCEAPRAGRRPKRRPRSRTGCTHWPTSVPPTATKADAWRCATISPVACSTIRWSMPTA